MTYLSTALSFTPRAHLRLGEAAGTFADSSGNGQTGAASGNVTRAVAGLLTGDSDNAVAFPATPGKVVITDSTTLDCGDVFTLVIWAKRTRTGSETIVQRVGFNSYVMSFGAADFAGIDQNGVGSHIRTQTAITDTNRHMIAYTKSGATAKMYLDGVDDTDIPSLTPRTFDDSFSTDIEIGSSGLIGTADEFSLYPTLLSAANIAALWTAGTTASNAPVWVSPADAVAMNLTPVLQFTSPASAVAQHFELQLDTANTFDTGNLQDIRTDQSQTRWEYWNGSVWTAFPVSGLPAGSSGNDVRYVVPVALAAGTWYRRVRAGS